MADYLPLIQRAVAALDPNTRERREAIYARAREALNRQLLSLDPPIATVDLQRERNALDDTIRIVETAYAPAQVAPPADDAVPTPRPPAAAPPADAPPAAVTSAPPPAEPETPVAVRPKLGRRTARTFATDQRFLQIVRIGLPVLLGFAVLAYSLRDDPARYVRSEGQAGGEAVQAGGSRKSEGRLDSNAGAGAPAQTQRPPAATGAQQLPVAARALFFEETTAEPRGVQSDGQVIWLSEPTPAGRGKPEDRIVRGTVSLPNARMSFDVVIRRNRETTLSASHIVEVIFRPEAGREGIKVIGPIEARDQETQPGIALKGAMVPIGTNHFLVGLDSNELAIAKNIEAMRDQKWFAFQFQLTNDRLGAALIEKGPTGERVFREAIESWSK